MSKCIQPQCKCAGYTEPRRPKNTLLQFKLNCQVCGHQASEHRKLTPVDHYIKSEVAAGRRARCTFHISPSDIPTSPVFGVHDFLMILSDDEIRPANVKENSVQCTCKGFKVPDVIRLCQAYRTHSMVDVASKLKDSLCSFCNHPLLSHSTNTSQDAQTESRLSSLCLLKGPALGPHHGLSLKNSSLLALSPVNSKCLELLVSSGPKRTLTLVVVRMSGTSDMFELGLLKYNGATTIPDSGTCEGNVPLSVTSDADIATPRGVVEPDKPGKLVSCTAKKVKTSSSEVAGKRARRSTRLATKKVRLEELQVRRKLKGLKGARRLYEEEESEGEEEERDNDLTEEEMGRVGEAAAGFVSSTEKQDQYVRFPLPRELSSVKSSSLMLAAVQVSERQSTMSRDSGQGHASVEVNGSSCLVAIGSKEMAAVYLAVASTARTEGTLDWVGLDSMGEETVDCIHMKEECSTDAGDGNSLLATGMSSGIVRVWTVVLEAASLKGKPVLKTEVDTSSQVLVTSSTVCSSDRLLAMGTASGKVFFSFLSDTPRRSGEDVRGATQGRPFSVAKGVQCSCAPVSCITWAVDGRMVAVGARDDAIQILQSQSPPKPRARAQTTSASLLNFFKKTDSYKWPRFIHTHTLKGHSSFIAGLTFSRGHFLVSLGWDGQLLFWKHFAHRRKSSGRCASKEHSYCSTVEIVEPVGGYKIGPSPSVEFLPSLVRPLMAGCGFLVAMDNKVGGVTVACYTKT